MILQKFLPVFVAVMLGLGNATCVCASMMDDTAHTHHQQQGQDSAKEAGCQHAGCMSDCNSLAAVTQAVDAPLSFKVSLQLDDQDQVKILPVAVPARLPAATATGPPYRRVMGSTETPVHRYDRLLD